MPTVDVIRYFVVAYGGFSVGLVFPVLRAHQKVYAKTEQPLALHVSLVTIAHIGLTLFALSEIVGHRGEPLSWRVVVTPPLFTLTALAMVLMYVRQRHKLSALALEQVERDLERGIAPTADDLT